jgi:hypothetical protein
MRAPEATLRRIAKREEETLIAPREILNYGDAISIELR